MKELKPQLRLREGATSVTRNVSTCALRFQDNVIPALLVCASNMPMLTF